MMKLLGGIGICCVPLVASAQGLSVMQSALSQIVNDFHGVGVLLAVLAVMIVGIMLLFGMHRWGIMISLLVGASVFGGARQIVAYFGL